MAHRVKTQHAAVQWECEQIGDCTLYRGSAADLLSLIGPVQVLLTDPPWQIGKQSVPVPNGGVAPYRQPKVTITQGQLGLSHLDTIVSCVACCPGDTFVIVGHRELGHLISRLPYYRCTFIWQRPNAALSLIYPAKLDSSFIVWAAQKSALYGHQHWSSMVFRIPSPQAGCFASERLIDASGKALHPAQGPLQLYEQLLAPLPQGTCLDPFMGTGTTGVACIKQGRPFIGIEIHEPYFQLACQRIREAYNQLRLFPGVPTMQTPKPLQEVLL